MSPRLGSLRPPSGLAGFDLAVDRICRAIEVGETIGVFGDYDVDGATTTALLTSFFRQLRGPTVARVARRDAGYGFGLGDVEFFADQRCGLVITGDTGTSDIAAIERAREQGIDVIVVDHHTVPTQDPSLPPHPALALINPFRADSTFPFRGMASVGLAFYLAAGIRTALRKRGFFAGQRPEPDVREFLDLVAVGTIADMVPLVGENRILTREGLRRLNQGARPGLRALLEVAGVDAARAIDEATVSWKIGPRVNAPGRLGDAGPALELLLADNDDDAKRWAEHLEQANNQRREFQDQVSEEALAMLEGVDPGPAVVVAGEGWKSGVVGIVAARLVDQFARPAFTIAIDPESGLGRGSARAVPGVNLYRALDDCSDLLVRFGGHAAAAGLTVERDNVPALRERLGQAVSAQLEESRDAAGAGLVLDAEVALGEVDEKLTSELRTLAPFGMGNEEPILGCGGLRVVESRRVGNDGNHLKLQLDDGTGVRRSAIAFGQAEDDPGRGATVHVAFAPTINEWGGRRQVELTVRRLQPVD